ncbi:hypothetical protein DPMN_005109 [Dreissena polymorpha]|uniref:HIRAN domain-containing protein n=1 Tax=Dreissena polymorpha TaxID=45954 RepID=A0A9D4MSV9_DREPO|nr:hypothetical protein DPMN_186282 [Dreissena polymorpha]KAH3881186.1 hypothetical protein DPMN_005109 [Dreissena polymorpha]
MRETTNAYDQYAVLVYDTTNGQNVGRIPLGLSSVISNAITERSLARSTVFSMGTLRHDGPQRGGGPKIECVYLLEFNEGVDIGRIAALLHDELHSDNIFL